MEACVPVLDEKGAPSGGMMTKVEYEGLQRAVLRVVGYRYTGHGARSGYVTSMLCAAYLQHGYVSENTFCEICQMCSFKLHSKALHIYVRLPFSEMMAAMGGSRAMVAAIMEGRCMECGCEHCSCTKTLGTPSVAWGVGNLPERHALALKAMENLAKPTLPECSFEDALLESRVHGLWVAESDRAFGDELRVRACAGLLDLSRRIHAGRARLEHLRSLGSRSAVRRNGELRLDVEHGVPQSLAELEQLEADYAIVRHRVACIARSGRASSLVLPCASADGQRVIMSPWCTDVGAMPKVRHLFRCSVCDPILLCSVQKDTLK
jgi:hypothetical protein